MDLGEPIRHHEVIPQRELRPNEPELPIPAPDPEREAEPEREQEKVPVGHVEL